MHFLSRRVRHRLLNLVVVGILALIASGVTTALAPRTSAAHAAPVAQAAPLGPCMVYWTHNSHYGFWDADYMIKAWTSCGGGPPEGDGYLYPCSGVDVTMNMDVWLSKSTQPGSQRLAESGRTGNETWAADCKWHRPAYVVGWGQVFTNPLWACMWVYDSTVGLSFDWLCTQDY